MTTGAGVLRSASSLADTGRALGEVAAALGDAGGAAAEEVRNLLTVGQALVTAATAREESRGSHTRTDFPETSAAFRCRLVLT
jgi:L-aspartate oxidase